MKSARGLPPEGVSAFCTSSGKSFGISESPETSTGNPSETRALGGMVRYTRLARLATGAVQLAVVHPITSLKTGTRREDGEDNGVLCCYGSCTSARGGKCRGADRAQ